MTRHEIAEKLRQLNRWRRGDDETLLMPDPAAIGHWIDAAADALEEQDKRAAELARVTAERDNYHAALIARHGGEPVALLAELDAERAHVAELEAQIERHAWTISPAMAQARIEQLAARVAELEAALRGILEIVDADGADESYDKAIAKEAACALARAGSAAPADPFPCRSDPLRKGTDYKAAPAKQGGAQ